jgi:hypothetical protein
MMDEGEQPMMAFVTHVNADDSVNVAGFTHYGALFNDHNVAMGEAPSPNDRTRPMVVYPMAAPTPMQPPTEPTKNHKKAKAGSQEE